MKGVAAQTPSASTPIEGFLERSGITCYAVRTPPEWSVLTVGWRCKLDPSTPALKAPCFQNFKPNEDKRAFNLKPGFSLRFHPYLTVELSHSNPEGEDVQSLIK